MRLPLNMSNFSDRRSKKEFIEWVHAWSQAGCRLEGLPDFIARKSREDKRMYEEALPVCHYVRKYHGDDVQVELPGDSGSADGKIYDGAELEYIQVTLPVEKDDHLVRKKLATTGRSVADFFVAGESISSYAAEVSRVIEKKLQFAYEKNTTLLVPMSADMVLEEEERFDAIVAALRPIPMGHRFNQIIVMDYVGKFC